MSLLRLELLKEICKDLKFYFRAMVDAMEGDQYAKLFTKLHEHIIRSFMRAEKMLEGHVGLNGTKLFTAVSRYFEFVEKNIEWPVERMGKYLSSETWIKIRDRLTAGSGEGVHKKFYTPAMTKYWWYGRRRESEYKPIYDQIRDYITVAGSEYPGHWFCWMVARAVADGKQIANLNETIEKMKAKYMKAEVIVVPGSYYGALPTGLSVVSGDNVAIVHENSFNIEYTLDPLIKESYILEHELAVGQYSGLNKRIIRRYQSTILPGGKYKPEEVPIGKVIVEDQNGTLRQMGRYDKAVSTRHTMSTVCEYNMFAEQKFFAVGLETHPRELIHTYEAAVAGPLTGGLTDQYLSVLTTAAMEGVSDIPNTEAAVDLITMKAVVLSEELRKLIISVYMPKPHHLLEFMITFNFNLENMLTKFHKEYRLVTSDVIMSGKIKEEILIPMTVTQRLAYMRGIFNDMLEATEIILTMKPSAIEDFDFSLKKTSISMLRW